MRDNNIQCRATKYKLSYDACVELLKITTCGICGKRNLKGRNQHIDHDHDTGQVRGILCAACNIKVGFFEKNLFSLHLFAKWCGIDLVATIEHEQEYKQFESKNMEESYYIDIEENLEGFIMPDEYTIDKDGLVIKY